MKYNEIFDFEANKLLELFSLLNAIDEVYSVEKLSIKLRIDPKTIMKYIKKLQDLFKRYHLEEHLDICCKQKNHFYLVRDSELSPEIFRVRYVNDLPEIMILKSIIEEKNVQTMQFVKKMSISESSVRKRVRKINEWLKQINLQLRRGTYEIIGEEEQIRAFILNFYWYVYQGTKNSFLLQETDRCEKLTNRLINFFQMQINDLQRETIFRIIQISIWRYRKGNKIKIKKEWHQYIKRSKLFSSFVETLWHNDSVYFQSKEELSYLYLIIQANFLSFYGRSILSFVIQEHFLKKTTCFQNTLQVTAKLKKVFWEKEFSYTKENLAAFLSFHLFYELISGFSYERNQSISIIQLNYPRFTAKLNDCLEELANEKTIPLEIPEKNQFYRYFMILTTQISPVYYEKKLVICLMTDFSIEKEQELGRKITQFFCHKVNMTIIFARTSKSIVYADLILTTTIYQATLKKCQQSVILLDSYFSDDFLPEIDKFIKKFR